jgi:hypothetical protein
MDEVKKEDDACELIPSSDACSFALHPNVRWVDINAVSQLQFPLACCHSALVEFTVVRTEAWRSVLGQ